MRNKRLIIIFSILLALTVIVLLGSIIFSVKTVNTRCLNNSYTDALLDEEILSNVGIEKGKSIFLVREGEIIKRIEENVPDVKVINLERKFPNRITVHYVKLFSYYEIASGGYYYSATYEGRIIKELEKAQDEEQKITIMSQRKGLLTEGDYFYDQPQRSIIKEIVSSFERLDLLEQKAAAKFAFIDIEKERDCLYIGIEGSGAEGRPIVIKIEGVSDLDTLYDKINLGYSTFLSPKFDRSPNADGVYQMVYVINPEDARGIDCDYYT